VVGQRIPDKLRSLAPTMLMPGSDAGGSSIAPPTLGISAARIVSPTADGDISVAAPASVRHRSSTPSPTSRVDHELRYDAAVRLLLAIALGCSASGGSVDSPSADSGSATDSASVIETSVADTATPDTDVPDTSTGDAIFPTEDTSIADVKSCPDCIDITVSVGDCGSVTCPTEYPYPVGCSITMGGTDTRGCVVHATGSSTVAFKVGSACSGAGDGLITGILRCSKTAGLMLNAMSCPISKPLKYYTMSLGGCPG
jgi:hypothetical protein